MWEHKSCEGRKQYHIIHYKNSKINVSDSEASLVLFQFSHPEWSADLEHSTGRYSCFQFDNTMALSKLPHYTCKASTINLHNNYERKGGSYQTSPASQTTLHMLNYGDERMPQPYITHRLLTRAKNSCIKSLVRFSTTPNLGSTSSYTSSFSPFYHSRTCSLPACLLFSFCSGP
jgi:hypothetical protein